MGFFNKITSRMPSLKAILLAILSAILLILAFPDFELWFLAWFALIPLFAALNSQKDSSFASAAVAWIFGTVFYFGTCWWLTFAPITYAGFPALLAYFLLFCATAFVGLYSALFAAVFSLLLRRFGSQGILFAPFLWTAIEFLRLWTSGNFWNSIGYSQAFSPFLVYASFGGVFLVGFFVVLMNAWVFWHLRKLIEKGTDFSLIHPNKLVDTVKNIDFKLSNFTDPKSGFFVIYETIYTVIPFFFFLGLTLFISDYLVKAPLPFENSANANVVAVQPNVPMSGLNRSKWRSLRERQARLAETALAKPNFLGVARRQAKIDALPEDLEKRTRFYEELALESFKNDQTTVILPESPMNFQYAEDPEFRAFIKDFASRNSVSVLFNSAEPDARREYGYFNSAVLVNEAGEKVIQYDKIYLLPFGEFVPLPEPLAQFVPTMVGRFSPGEEYDLLPFGDAKAGIMICFESHFPSLAREYVRGGADVLIEMTNDGYLGNTSVLRQHLASATFRAVETNRPVIRVTNVGITAY
ncbi:MAG: apolipoprotein N-acyltransferase, partial [Pyrinomonadaceae bacterium]|nr:apolipoprotein N-acyltransferase [Pyrinomonadaceae bacterium]